MSNLVGKFFQHYKRKNYYVFNVSIHTETQAQMVNYISLYATDTYPFGTAWSRPIHMWDEIIDSRPRFVEITPTAEEKEQTLIFIKKMLLP